MNDQSHQDPDESLVSDLRAFFARADPVPALVPEAAKAALGWRRLDADLAELLSDSALESDTLVAVRGGGAPARSVSFRAGELTIDVEIHADDAGLVLLGMLAPPSSATLEVQRADGEVVATTESDVLGRFRVKLPAGGPIRLRLLPPADSSASEIHTSWITI
jgi:hypothetical protein